MTNPGRDTTGRFPADVVLSVDPPTWLCHLVLAGLSDDSLSAWSRIPKSKAEFEHSRFDHAEADSEAKLDGSDAAQLADQLLSESEHAAMWSNHEEEVLLDLALALMAYARVAADPDDLVHRIMEWCEDEIDRVWEQMDTAQDRKEKVWCEFRSSCIQDFNEAFDDAAGRLQPAFAELIEARR